LPVVINDYAAARNRIRDGSRAAANGAMKTDVISRPLKLEIKRLGFKPLRPLRFYFTPFGFFAGVTASDASS